MKVDLCIYPMTLTLMRGHSGSAEEHVQLWIVSTTTQAIQINLAATVGLLLQFEIVSTRGLELWSHERLT